MSQDISQQLIDIERRVRALEDAKVSYTIGDVSANAQVSSERIREAIVKEIDRYVKSLGLTRAVN